MVGTGDYSSRTFTFSLIISFRRVCMISMPETVTPRAARWPGPFLGSPICKPASRSLSTIGPMSFTIASVNAAMVQVFATGDGIFEEGFGSVAAVPVQTEQIHARAPVDAAAADYRGRGAGTRSLAFGQQNGPLACLRCRDSGQHARCATADNQNVDLALSGHPCQG